MCRSRKKLKSRLRVLFKEKMNMSVKALVFFDISYAYVPHLVRWIPFAPFLRSNITHMAISLDPAARLPDVALRNMKCQQTLVSILSAIVFSSFLYVGSAYAAKCDICSGSLCGCHSLNSWSVAKNSKTKCSVPPYDSCETCATYCGGLNLD